MAFCIIMGTQNFTRPMEEYKGQQFICRNCGNGRAYAQKSWKWFTVCFIPVIPFSAGWHRDVHCPTCRVEEDLKHRPDITSGQANQGQQLQQGMGGGYYGGGPPQQGTMGGGEYGGGPPQQGYGGGPPQQGHYK